MGEEGVETALAAVTADDAALRGEAADLTYHLLVLLRARGLGWDDVRAELARRAGVSVLTIDRVEKCAPCRLDTKRKIILALGLKVTDRDQVFED